MLDYSGDLAQTGKNLGDDLAEGKNTLPLIYLMHHGTQPQRELVRRVITQGNRGDFDSVLNAIRDSGALAYAHDQARAEAQRAAQHLQPVANSKYRDCLLELTTFAVDRKY
jgi:octaprenyl-diphosphate synthase